MKLRNIFVAITVTLVAIATMILPHPSQAKTYDHLKCYKTKDPHNYGAWGVTLTPPQTVPFAVEAGCKLKIKSKQFCTPVDKYVSMTNAPVVPVVGQELKNDYICYRMKCPPALMVSSLSVTDQFGTRALAKFKPKTLCVPAVKTCPESCPDKLRMTTAAGVGPVCTTNADCNIGLCDTSVGRCRTRSKIDLGFGGGGFNNDLNGMVQLSLGLSCPGGVSGTCGDCAINGVDCSTGQCRCSNDNRTECSIPFSPDPACGGAQCNAYANPPLPFFTPGTSSSCVVSRLSQDLSGTFNVDSGGSVLDIDLNLGAHLGISPNKPCPYCTGDATPCDGVNAGTCVGGVNDGQTCDECGVNGNFPTPGGDGVSLDCFPDPNLNVSGSGLEVSLSPFTTGSVSLPFATGCDAQFAAFNCACAVCSGDPTLACVNDAECSLAGAGTCDSFGTGAVRAPNRCNTLVCNPIGGPAYAPEGYCGDICLGPYDMFCDGTLLGNGQPYYSCSADIDCEVLDPDCPGGDCGDCSIQRLRPCHIDPIAATGVQDADTPMMVSTFCIPPTLNPAINNGIGLPGPGRIVQEFETSMLCPSDPGLAYVPGVGFQ